MVEQRSNQEISNLEFQPQLPFVRAVSFDSPQKTTDAFNSIAHDIFSSRSEVAVYGLRTDPPSVALLGLGLPDLEERISKVLAEGEEAELSGQEMTIILKKREQTYRTLPWVEGTQYYIRS